MLDGKVVITRGLMFRAQFKKRKFYDRDDPLTYTRAIDRASGDCDADDQRHENKIPSKLTKSELLRCAAFAPAVVRCPH